MKVDHLTRTMLAVLIGLVAWALFGKATPPAIAAQQAATERFGQLQFSATTKDFVFFDTHSGELYVYDRESNAFTRQLKLPALGEHLQNVK